MLERELAHERRDAAAAKPGVVPQAHGCGAGVVRLAADGDLLPGDALHALDRTDRDALGLEHRTLFDVQLDEGVGHQARARMGPA